MNERNINHYGDVVYYPTSPLIIINHHQSIINSTLNWGKAHDWSKRVNTDFVIATHLHQLVNRNIVSEAKDRVREGNDATECMYEVMKIAVMSDVEPSFSMHYLKKCVLSKEEAAWPCKRVTWNYYWNELFFLFLRRDENSWANVIDDAYFVRRGGGRTENTLHERDNGVKISSMKKKRQKSHWRVVLYVRFLFVVYFF